MGKVAADLARRERRARCLELQEKIANRLAVLRLMGRDKYYIKQIHERAMKCFVYGELRRVMDALTPSSSDPSLPGDLDLYLLEISHQLNPSSSIAYDSGVFDTDRHAYYNRPQAQNSRPPRTLGKARF